MYIGFVKADRQTQAANIVVGTAYKFLIPKEFGGGYIRDHYQDYGCIHSPTGAVYDAFELLAFWNSSQFPSLKTKLQYDGEFPPLKEKDQYTFQNRQYGIKMFSVPSILTTLRYPLRFVSATCKLTYEQCDRFSFLDPKSAITTLTWKDAEVLYGRLV